MPSSKRATAEVVSSPAAKYLAATADLGTVDLRADASVRAGSHVHEGPALSTAWHDHELHQLEYACHGAVGLETAHAQYLLPPHQAAWIPAGVRHISTLGDARTVSVFFAPDLVDDHEPRARILAVSALVREMVLYAQRWPIARVDRDPVADAFFLAMGQLLPTWLEHEAPFALPVSSDPLVAAAIAYTRDHLRDVTPSVMSRALGTSERTLRRRFMVECSMTWRDYLSLARTLEALKLLAAPEPSILQVAIDVGFESATSFTRAFTRHTGETPSAYRRRVTTPEPT